MKVVKADKKGIELAIKYLKRGKSVVYPTDTSYGLGVDATNLKAVKRLLKIKERTNRPVHVIVSSLAMAKKYAVFNGLAERIFKKLLPGRLTLVLDLQNNAPQPPLKLRGEEGELLGEAGKAFRLLSAGTGTLGIRMPDNKIALSLVRRLDQSITTTSANPSWHLSYGTTPYSVADSLRQFKDKRYQPDLYLDAGKLPKIKPSTLAEIKNGKIRILRKGPVSLQQILKAIR